MRSLPMRRAAPGGTARCVSLSSLQRFRSVLNTAVGWMIAGWVERSETHRRSVRAARSIDDGFRFCSAHPTSWLRPDLAGIVRGVELAGARLAREGDQVLGDDPGGDDFLDPAFLEARPGVAPERLAIVGLDAQLPAHLEQHGEAALEVPHGELAGPRRPLAPVRIGAVDLVVVAPEQPRRIVGIFQA